MSESFDLAPQTELPRQRSFLRAVVPVLAKVDLVLAIWLAGSLARGQGDRWSSVDLCLLWDEGAPAGSPAVAGQYEAVDVALSRALGDGGYLLDSSGEGCGGGRLRGITLASASPSEGGRPAVAGGVVFRIDWAPAVLGRALRRRHGPVNPLYLADHLADGLHGYLQGKFAALEQPTAVDVQGRLDRFWILLARLPAVVRRREEIAAHALLTELRTLLINMVVALNGASRPQSAARINQYLGVAQQEAFERSLGNSKPTSMGVQRTGAAGWIGQAVALIVLYRWYAPQLVEMYGAPYPQRAEETVLDLLVAEIEGWPAQITTG